MPRPLPQLELASDGLDLLVADDLRLDRRAVLVELRTDVVPALAGLHSRSTERSASGTEQHLELVHRLLVPRRERAARQRGHGWEDAGRVRGQVALDVLRTGRRRESCEVLVEDGLVRELDLAARGERDVEVPREEAGAEAGLDDAEIVVEFGRVLLGRSDERVGDHERERRGGVREGNGRREERRDELADPGRCLSAGVVRN